MKLNDLLRQGYGILKNAGISGNYHTDAQLVLAKVLNKDRLFILTNPDFMVSDNDSRVYTDYIQKLSEGCPLPYILGECDFFGLDFMVTPAVLIPRPDTEVLAVTALDIINGAAYDILEIGTGSGCIAVSLYKNAPASRITAVDISDTALDTARYNAKRHDARVDLIKSDVYNNIPPGLMFDIIISNPPYINTAGLAFLDTSVKDYEPVTALDGGYDGAEFYRRIIKDAGKYLKPGGYLLFEIGYNMAEQVTELLQQYGYNDIHIHKDGAGLDRVITGKQRGGLCSVN